jgi:hypothetical protein
MIKKGTAIQSRTKQCGRKGKQCNYRRLYIWQSVSVRYAISTVTTLSAPNVT